MDDAEMVEAFSRVMNELSWKYVDCCDEIAGVTESECMGFRGRVMDKAREQIAALAAAGVKVSRPEWVTRND